MERVATSRRPEPAAWEGLEEMREGLRGFLARQCTDDNDVEDVVQETFLRAARYRRTHRVRNLRPWATRIALNVLADARRRVVRTQATAGASGPEEVPEREAHEPEEVATRIDDFWLEGESAGELLRSSLAELRQPDRQLLDAYYRGGLCTRVASAECGVPRHLVKVRLYRARKRLLAALRQVIAREPRWRRLAS